jgi:hypothetical protein
MDRPRCFDEDAAQDAATGPFRRRGSAATLVREPGATISRRVGARDGFFFRKVRAGQADAGIACGRPAEDPARQVLAALRPATGGAR